MATAGLSTVLTLPATAETSSDPVVATAAGAAVAVDPSEPVVVVEPAPEDPLTATDTASLYAAAGLPVPAQLADTAPIRALAAGPGTGSGLVPGISQHVAPSCTGTGTDGNRVQAMYVREQSQPDRYADVLPVLRNELRTIDDVFAVSAKQTGGGRRVRWVTDSSCVLSVANVVVPDGALATSFDTTVQALQNQGFNRNDRKYLAFTDTNAEMIGMACGLGQSSGDTRPGQENYNNGYMTAVARVNLQCWVRTSHSSAAHELVHTLGAVQYGSPNGSSRGHCNDEADLMCYDDGATGPMRDVCPADQEDFLDCGKDDYFNTNPAPGSYLDTHWNIANSSFLDTVAPLADAPTVTVTASRTSAETGDDVTLTATSSRPATITWETTNADCIKGAATGSTITLNCPWMYGTQTVTAYASVDGVAGSNTKTITITRAAAPAVSFDNPAASPGQAFTTTATVTSGKGPFTYRWGNVSSGCTVSGGLTGTSLTRTCSTAMAGQYAEAYLDVTTGDQRTLRTTVFTQVAGNETPTLPSPNLTVTDLPSAGKSGIAEAAAVQNTGAPVTTWHWSADGGCLVGPTDRSTVTVQCPLHITGPITVAVTGTTEDGVSQTVGKTITLTKPTVAYEIGSPDAGLTSTPEIVGRVYEAGSGAGIRAKMALEASTDGGSSYTAVTASKIVDSGTLSTVVAPEVSTDYRVSVVGAGTTPALHVSVHKQEVVTPGLAASRGYPTTFKSSFRDTAGHPLAGLPVQLQVRWEGTRRWRTVATTTTASSGTVGLARVRYPVTTQAGTFRMVFTGNTVYQPVTTTTRYVRIPTRLAATVKTGRPNVLRATLTTGSGVAIAGAPVILQRKYAGTSRWAQVKVFTANRYGRVASKQQPGRKTYYRWVFRQNRTTSGSTSKPLTVGY